MYTGLLHIHSVLRYVLLLLLVAVIIKSVLGIAGKKAFSGSDDKFSLFLLIAAHLQAVIGLLLYFTSSFVQFNGSTMKDPVLRYWSVEHITMMIVAVALITIGRVTMKKIQGDPATAGPLRHQRLFYLNTAALVVILAAILMSGRGL